MGQNPKYSVIIPVFNRNDELMELLESLTRQTFLDFEVIVVDDGSSITASKVCENYSTRLSIQYFYKQNSGPGPSRNFGFDKSRGIYLVMFDSDCILPATYFESVEKFMTAHPIDAWGGPDKGHEKFTIVQRAMAFTMSSIFTTGGIRGGENQVHKFQPRSFNMGMSRDVIAKTGGFKFDRLAEDIELSIRMRKEGFRVSLIPEAFVFHKRRTTFRQFFKQVQGFGKGRVRVGKIHSGEIKLTHWFPTAFMIGLIVIALGLFFYRPLGSVGLAGLYTYLFLIFIDGLRVTRSLKVALLSIPSAIIQLVGYGSGFLSEYFKK
ncbi:MAG: glycosyltransferase [Cyclobacteriaceae bacterium]|nr:glycosyltransferase [Cyclobacteriaceae bacterium]